MVRQQWGVVLVMVFLLLVDSTFEQLFNSRTERFALLQLRSSLGLRAKEWPVKVGPCSGWVGVSCVNGSVVGINISGFKRTRKGSRNPQFSVDSLQNLTMLTSFNASLFLLPGPIPGWFGLKMSSLQVLDLTSCSINGSLPASLGNLTSLTQLHLSRNGLSGTVPSSLGELPNLSVLDLSHNSLTGAIPPAIGALSKLRFLNLSGNSFSSSIPSEIGNLSSLTGLDLSHNSLSGSLPANVFPPLTKLKFLVLGHNNFTGSFPAALWSMPLQFLDASANRFTGSLPNITLTASAPTTFFNLSRNEFYGYLTIVVQGFSFIDLSGNYFEGKVPTYVHGNVSISRNCLQNVKNQRGGSECVSFYKARGLLFDSGQPNTTQSPPPPPPPRHNKSHRKTIILAAVLGGVGLIIAVILILVMLLMICARKNTASQGGTGVGPAPTTSSSPSPPPPGLSLNLSSLGDAFTYQQILQATSDFKDENLMKHGHSGDLFRGLLEGGIPVVIKRIDLQSVKREAYLVELDFFSKVSHTRIVPLLGHCLENENQKFLVYKYMPNGDLSSSLFKKNDSDDDSLQSLDWITRLKIAIGAAEALSYLHHECTPPRVHRDVQSSSILLDDKFEVRLGSLSEVCAQEADPHQSRISRFLRLQQTPDQSSSGSHSASCTYDVYCFGKVLLELVTGRLGLSGPDGDGNAKEWLDRILPYISIYEKELVTKIVDPSLIIDEDLLEEVWAMAIVARSCLNPKPSRRPLMRYILKALENPLKVVREEHSTAGSARLKATSSSRGSWNAATLFGSWRQSSSDVRPSGSKAPEGTTGSYKRSRTSGSQGSGPNNGEGGGGGGGHSSSSRRSKEIFPEPLDEDAGGRPAE